MEVHNKRPEEDLQSSTRTDKDARQVFLLFADELAREAESIVDKAVDLVMSDLPEYAMIAKTEDSTRLAENCRHHLQIVCGIAREPNPEESSYSDFAFRASEARAAQGLSIEAVLRSSQFLTQIVWNWLIDNPTFGDSRDDVIRNCWPIWLRYVDHLARESAAAYVKVSKERAQQDSMSRRNLLEQLLHGRLTSLEAHRSMHALGFKDTMPFRIALLRWWDLSDDETFGVLEQAMRLANSNLERTLSLRPLTMTQDHSIVIVTQCADSEAGKVRDQLRSVVSSLTNKNFQISGAISGPVSDLSTLHTIHTNLAHAAAVSRYEKAIVFTSEISLLDHSIGAMHDSFSRVCPEELKQFIAVNRKSCALWQETLEAFARHNLSVRETAVELQLHPNTVYYRLNQIGTAANRNTQTLQGFLDVLIALRLRAQLDEFD